jgi:hypothetical protein
MPVPRPEYDLHLDEQEAQLVLQGLGELPAKLGYNLITRVAQIVATTNQAWQTSNQTQPGNGLDLAQPVQSMHVDPGPQGSVPQDNP